MVQNTNATEEIGTKQALHWSQCLEPSISGEFNPGQIYDATTVEFATKVSIAISLKRLADAADCLSVIAQDMYMHQVQRERS